MKQRKSDLPKMRKNVLVYLPKYEFEFCNYAVFTWFASLFMETLPAANNLQEFITYLYSLI